MEQEKGRRGLLGKLDKRLREDFLKSGREVVHSAGKVIHREGDADRALQIVLEGEVSIGRVDRQGNEVQAVVLVPGDSFGEIPLLTGRARTHNAVAITRVRLLRITPQVFRDLLDRHPPLRELLLAELASMLADALDLLDQVQRLTIPERVVNYLLQMTQDGPDRQALAVRQADIALALNVTRESVAAALRQLREDGRIETAYRSIMVPSVSRLGARA